jgi:hypothetical protein
MKIKYLVEVFTMSRQLGITSFGGAIAPYCHSLMALDGINLIVREDP